ncbi:MAG: PEP-CTERM sorting domain-containing protein [Phycisphaerae bacterium]
MGTGNWLARIAVAVAVILRAATAAANVGYLDETGIVAWRRDNDGQVSDTPGGTDFIAIAAFDDHSLALKADGSVVAWGEDDYGEVADAPTGMSFIAVTTGRTHSVGLKDDGSLVSWGRDDGGHYDYGQVSNTPIGNDFVAVAAGAEHNLALKNNGSLVGWGQGDYDIVGTEIGSTPTGSDFVAIAAGNQHNLALRSDGSLVGWGYDQFGQVSDIPSDVEFIAMAAGAYHSLALRSDGSLAAWGPEDWGFADEGQVRDTPAGNDFAAVAAGHYHNLVLKNDGSLVSWGCDNYGQVSGMPTGSGFTAVAAGFQHSLAIGPALDYDDLIVTGTGATALLNRDITVHGNATIETAMVTENSPTMAVQGTTTFTAGGSVVLESGETLATRDLHIENGGLVEVDGGTLRGYYHSLENVSVQTGGQLQVHGDFRQWGVSLLLGGLIDVHDGRLRLGETTVQPDGLLRVDNECSLGHTSIQSGGRLEVGGDCHCASLHLEGATVEADSFSGGEIAGHGVVDAALDGCSALTADGGTLTVGKPDSYSGFAMSDSGGITVKPGATLELLAKGFVSLPRHVTLDSGTLAAPNGILVCAGHNLPGSGSVAGRVSADFGSTVEATGPLSLGDADAYDGFFSDGSLLTGANTVTINDRNEAVLGSLTELGDGASGGTLTAGAADPSDTHAHFLLEQGKNMVGRGEVNGNYKNHGHVIGDGTAMDERVVFNDPWIITGKGTFENTLILGTFAMGESPAMTSGTNQGFGGTVQVELGGTMPGFGDDNHDQIADAGTILLVGGPTLEILPWSEFVPEVGDEFVVMTWAVGLDGAFGDAVTHAWFTDHDIVFDLHYDNVDGPGSLTLEAVPEPATLALLAAGALALARRRA